MTLENDMQDLESAEDFLQYFGLAYDQSIVHVNRLHILQRFHDYLDQANSDLPDHDEARREIYAKLLNRAYQDFVESDAQTEKVFKVFHMNEAQSAFVPLSDIK